MANEQVNLDIVAKDKASEVIEDVAEGVEELEKKDHEVVLVAEIDKAKANLKDLQDQLKDLQDRKAEITVTADTTKAKRSLDDIADKSDVGDRFGASFVRDVGSVLDEETAGLAGDFTDAFTTGLGALGTAIPATVLGPLTAAISVGGLAFVAITTFWKKFRDDAGASIEDIKKVRDAILEVGSVAAAQRQVTDLLKEDPDLVRNINKLGLTYADLVAIVQGKAVPAYEAYRDAEKKVKDSLIAEGDVRPASDALSEAAAAAGLTEEQYLLLLPAAIDVNEALSDTEDAFAQGKDAAKGYATVLTGSLTPGLETVNADAGPAATSVGDLSREMTNVDRTVRPNVQVTSDDSELDETKGKVDALDGRTVEVKISPDFGNFEARLAQAFATSGVTATRGTINISMPRGTRGTDVVAALNRHTRRAGSRL